MKKLLVLLCSMLLLLGMACPVGALLFDRSGGMIYDSDQNITWLQDANYIVTSGWEGSGGWDSGWTRAKAWVDQLEYGGFDDWRLPKTVDQCMEPECEWGHPLENADSGYNITSSEMGYMYYVNLGNLGFGHDEHPVGWGLSNTGPFINIMTGGLRNVAYWSETYRPSQGDYWWFSFELGLQDSDDECHFLNAWAVRDGNVPEPATMLLLGTGLVGLAGFGRKRFKK